MSYDTSMAEQAVNETMEQSFNCFRSEIMSDVVDIWAPFSINSKGVAFYNTYHLLFRHTVPLYSFSPLKSLVDTVHTRPWT